MHPLGRLGTLFRRAWPFVAVGAISILAAGFLISRRMQDVYLRQSHERLEHEAALLGEASAAMLRLGDPSACHERVREWQRLLDLRVTLIDSAGMVVADSDWPEDSAVVWSGHVPATTIEEEPERSRWDIRYSQVWNSELLYASETIQSDGHVLGSLRLALPLSTLDSQKAAVRNVFLTILLVTGVLLIALSVWVSNSIRRPLLRLTQATARFSKGDWEARAPIDPYRSSDEFSELAHDFNRMADEVQVRFNQSRHERDQLQAVLANMSEGVLAIDSAGKVRLVNDAFLRLFRSVHDDPVGHTHAEAFRERGLNDLIDKLLLGQSEEMEELEIQAPQRRILVIHPALIDGARGDSVRGVLVARDVTARRQLDQVRRDFVANASHELRTPLTSILGYVTALRDTEELGPSAEAFLETIERNALRMNRIVGDMLELSRIEAPGYRPEIISFSLQSLVAEIRQSLAQVLAARAQSLLVAIPADADSCNADRDAVSRILLNLLDNAIKYSPDGQIIELTVRRQGDELILVVADQGPGVPESDRPRLFERFFRVDRGRSRELGGTGLGLAIVKHLAESHGGSAHYEPNVLRGSRFVVRLPQGAAAAGAN